MSGTAYSFSLFDILLKNKYFIFEEFDGNTKCLPNSKLHFFKLTDLRHTQRSAEFFFTFVWYHSTNKYSI